MAWIASFGFLAVQVCWPEAHLARVMSFSAWFKTTPPRGREYCSSWSSRQCLATGSPAVSVRTQGSAANKKFGFESGRGLHLHHGNSGAQTKFASVLIGKHQPIGSARSKRASVLIGKHQPIGSAQTKRVSVLIGYHQPIRTAQVKRVSGIPGSSAARLTCGSVSAECSQISIMRQLLMMLQRVSLSGYLPKIDTSCDRSREVPDTFCSSVADGSRQTGGSFLLSGVGNSAYCGRFTLQLFFPDEGCTRGLLSSSPFSEPVVRSEWTKGLSSSSSSISWARADFRCDRA